MSEKNLNARWIGLWNGLGASGDPNLVYDDLLSRYSEPGRAYHTLEHIEHCLTELETVSNPAADLKAIEFALWFHDAIYDTASKDNEERSAVLARRTAVTAELPASFADLIERLILATKHASPPGTLNEAVLVDIDLSILGQDPSIFDKYERDIREEYRWVPADAFAQGRSTVLSSILERERIYTTEPFHSKYESRARENLARSIALLS